MECKQCGREIAIINNKAFCFYCGFDGQDINLVQHKPKEAIKIRNQTILEEANENLLNNLDGSMDYCKTRGITLSVIKDWKLGYVPNNYFNMNEVWYKRLLFPITANNNEYIIAFGGRIIKQENRPKYINSKTSYYYNKRISLYGYNLVQSNAQRIFLCEGYMDVISMASHGHKNAVASLGTSLTEEQALLIKQKTNEVYICYDADSAGERATVRALGILLRVGFTPNNINVIRPTEAKDVDEALTKGSALECMSVIKYLSKTKHYDVLARLAVEVEAKK